MEQKNTFDFSVAGALNKLKPAQLSTLIGEVTSLMMLSPVHRVLQVRDIADIMLPALNLAQYRIYHTPDRKPIALVTWAYFSPEVEAAYLGGKGMLSEAERKSGAILYLTDFIAPYGHAKQVVRDLRSQVFPNEVAKALRFVETGKTRPDIWQLRGANYRKALH